MTMPICSGGIGNFGRTMTAYRMLHLLSTTRRRYSPAGAGSTGAVEAVAGVAEAGHDVALLVQPAVDRGGHDPHVGMLGPDVLDAFGRRDEADERHRARAGVLD